MERKLKVGDTVTIAEEYPGQGLRKGVIAEFTKLDGVPIASVHYDDGNGGGVYCEVSDLTLVEG